MTSDDWWKLIGTSTIISVTITGGWQWLNNRMTIKNDEKRWQANLNHDIGKSGESLAIEQRKLEVDKAKMLYPLKIEKVTQLSTLMADLYSDCRKLRFQKFSSPSFDAIVSEMEPRLQAYFSLISAFRWLFEDDVYFNAATFRDTVIKVITMTPDIKPSDLYQELDGNFEKLTKEMAQFMETSRQAQGIK